MGMGIGSGGGHYRPKSTRRDNFIFVFCLVVAFAAMLFSLDRVFGDLLSEKRAARLSEEARLDSVFARVGELELRVSEIEAMLARQTR